MNSLLIQLRSAGSAPEELVIEQTAGLLGLEVVKPTSLEAALTEAKRSQSSKRTFGLALSGSALRELAGNPAAKQILLELRSLCDCLVHGFPLPVDGGKIFRESFQFEVSPSSVVCDAEQQIWKFEQAIHDSPLAGHGFERKGAQSIATFDGKSVYDAAPLITINDQPLLVRRARAGSRHDYLLAQVPRVNLDAALVPPHVSSDFHGEVLPVAVALKQIFGKACWHNPFPTGCVIVDDPLLSSRYGFFEYADVLGELSKHRYSTTVAFISSNFRRSDPRIVRQVSENRERISICVHGCDHTGGEFGEPNTRSIENKAAKAMDCMRRHETITGLPFDRVMVFPQGVFSSCAPAALKKSGYFAAVNTVPYPTDHEAAPVSIADTLQLAILRYALFPVFTRRYPVRLFDFATDLFWAKPVFVVEHHGYYEGGARRMSELVRRLQQLQPHVQWLTLENAVIRSGQYKTTGNDSYEVRFVTPVFVLKNPQTVRTRILCRKPESAPDAVLEVTMDGQPVSFVTSGNELSLEVMLDGGKECVIVVKSKPVEIKTFNPSWTYRFKAFVRRRLSEFRDNHVSRNKQLLQFAVRMHRRLKGRD